MAKSRTLTTEPAVTAVIKADLGQPMPTTTYDDIARRAFELFCEREADMVRGLVPGGEQSNDVIAATTRDALARVRAEYLEMPGMTLTARDVQRLCGIQSMLCQAVLDALVDAKFLCLKVDGGYGRFTDVAIARPRPAKAALGSHGRVEASMSEGVDKHS